MGNLIRDFIHKKDIKEYGQIYFAFNYSQYQNVFTDTVYRYLYKKNKI